VSVVQYEELAALSGFKQVSKVISFLRSNRIRYVLGGDGKPRTTHDLLKEDLTDERKENTSEIRFT
jgi:hypothetical protein